VREDDAVAVDDETAVGRHRHDGDAVRLRQRVELAVLDDLQIEDAPGEHNEHDKHERRRDRQPHPEVVDFEPRVAYLYSGVDGEAVAHGYMWPGSMRGAAGA